MPWYIALIDFFSTNTGYLLKFTQKLKKKLLVIKCLFYMKNKTKHENRNNL